MTLQLQFCFNYSYKSEVLDERQWYAIELRTLVAIFGMIFKKLLPCRSCFSNGLLNKRFASNVRQDLSPNIIKFLFIKITQKE